MTHREFKYPINDREIYLSDNAARAGEEAFGRPADLNERKEFADLSERIAAKFPLRDIRDRVDDYDRDHWDEYDEGDYIDFDFRAGDVVVDRCGTPYLVGDINLGKGECSCCSVGSSNKVQWKGYIPFEDYASV